VKTQLLCTFTNEESFESIIEKVFKYELFSRKIFILKLEPSNELVVSYNIVANNSHQFLPETIMVHRKKESNTMYTINALNSLISSLNGGIVDKEYQVDWNHYQNTLILTNGNGYKIMKTSLFKIVDVNK
jgi:hypothetical protein